MKRISILSSCNDCKLLEYKSNELHFYYYCPELNLESIPLYNGIDRTKVEYELDLWFDKCPKYKKLKS